MSNFCLYMQHNFLPLRQNREFPEFRLFFSVHLFNVYFFRKWKTMFLGYLNFLQKIMKKRAYLAQKHCFFTNFGQKWPIFSFTCSIIFVPGDKIGNFQNFIFFFLCTCLTYNFFEKKQFCGKKLHTFFQVPLWCGRGGGGSQKFYEK